MDGVGVRKREDGFVMTQEAYAKDIAERKSRTR